MWIKSLGVFYGALMKALITTPSMWWGLKSQLTM